MGPFDDLTETQRQQIREAHAANKEREMNHVKAYGRAHNREPGIRCWCQIVHEPEATEPYCNHDPAAITNGVCECGEVVKS
jgi:hypothetical protein